MYQRILSFGTQITFGPTAYKLAIKTLGYTVKTRKDGGIERE